MNANKQTSKQAMEILPHPHLLPDITFLNNGQNERHKIKAAIRKKELYCRQDCCYRTIQFMVETNQLFVEGIDSASEVCVRTLSFNLYV